MIVISLLAALAVPGAEPGLKKYEFKVGDTTREALIYYPKKNDSSAPLVFAFHGHGGNMNNAARKFAFHELWPEAVCVYMQGLNTATKNDPKGDRPGWQPAAGNNDDRDLKFFDEVLKTIKRDFKIDDKRIYSAGHSNGGGFTYLLWQQRGATFTALGPIAAGGRNVKDCDPKPVIHVAGKGDKIVTFEIQTNVLNAVKKLNQCDDKGKPWGKAKDLEVTLYESPKKAPLVTVISAGGHEIPDGATKLIIEFFKMQSK